MNTTTQHPLSRLDPDDITSAWTARGLDRITDAELLHAACQQLSVPRDGEANSFTLHAPLELMARAQPLPMVSRQRRESARQRSAHIAATWATTGASTETVADTSSIEHPLDALDDALRHGDPATADRAFVTLCARREPVQTRDARRHPTGATLVRHMHDRVELIDRVHHRTPKRASTSAALRVRTNRWNPTTSRRWLRFVDVASPLEVSSASMTSITSAVSSHTNTGHRANARSSDPDTPSIVLGEYPREPNETMYSSSHSC